MNLIEIINVSKTFGGNKAVDNISLVIPDGEIVGFLGPNGAGKTTTIRMITGILKSDSGSIKINGIDIEKEPIKAKKQFGFVPDNPDMFLRLKGIEYLNFMADVYEVSEDDRKARIDNLAERFGMAEALFDEIQGYSHGMRQKIVLMGALIHDPSVWILDEPMTGLDPKSSFTLKEMMKEHAAKGKTLFFSTHVLDVAEKICTKVAIINKGRILFYGSMEDLKYHSKGDESLEKIFLELVENE